MDKPVILMVDEDRNFLEIIKLKLEVEGLLVELATVPQIGLRMAHEDSPNLILLDVNMPGMNGIEFLTNLKNDPATKDLKVILYTSMVNMWKAHMEMSDIARELGAVDFIEKGADLNEVVKKIREALRKG